MKRFVYFLMVLLFSKSIYAQVLVSKTLLVSYTKQQLDSLLEARNIPTTIFTTRLGVDAYKLVYETQDYDSTTKIASALLAVPNGVDCEFTLLNYSHGTTSVKEDVPSRLNGEGLVGLVAASNGYVMCLPDYLGMGDSPWPHYYLHAYTQAMANINLLRATREVCADLNVQLNDQLFLSGYSQGGFSTMATHKYIQTYFANEFNITKSFPGAGSYDMSGAMVDLMISDVDYPSPGYLPFLLFTWNPIYNLFNSPSDYFRAPYDTTLANIVDGLNSIGDINDFMPDTPKLIFKQAVIDSFIANPNHPLRLALKDNDIYEWVPQDTMLMIHCEADRQVPIENTRNAYNYFTTNGATLIDTLSLSTDASHGECGQLYLLYLKGTLDALALQDPCLTASVQKQTLIDFVIKPNPTVNNVYLQLPQMFATNNNQVMIYDMQGKLMWQQAQYNGEKISLSSWAKGMYFVKVQTDNATGIKKLIVE
jgi:hypothetical protein